MIYNMWDGHTKQNALGQWQCVLLGVIVNKYSCIEWVYVCVPECVTFARMVLTHINVKIHSEVRYRPLMKITFHVHHFGIIS